MNRWILLSIALLLNAGANVLMKIGATIADPISNEAPFVTRVFNFLNAPTIWGIGLFAGNVLVYRKLLEKLNISVAYPIMVSSGLVLVTLAAATLPLLSEKVSLAQAAGMALIAAGVWFVSRG